MRHVGARGRNRTGTVSLPLDFESSASTSFTTRAVSLLYNSGEKVEIIIYFS